MPILPLPAEQLVWTVPDGLLPFETTDDLEPTESIIGQASALAAIRRGVGMEAPGFNVFVVGLHSTGRLGTVRRILADLDPRRRAARDFVYVRNFRDPVRPRLLEFPAGRGLAFRKELLKTVGLLLEEVPRILRSDEVRRARDRGQQTAAVAHHGALAKLEAHAEELGFGLGREEGDEDSPPVVLWQVKEGKKGEPRLIGRAEVQVLAESGKLPLPVPLEEVQRRFELLEEELADVLDASRQVVTETVRQVAEAEEQALRAGTRKLFSGLGRRWPPARAWLAELHDELVESPEWFDEDEPDHDALLAAFSVNLVHRGSRSRKAPVVVAANPTWQLLLGGIEGEPGSIDHTSIRGGQLLDADGGFLVLHAADLLLEPGAWKVLKRALVYGLFEPQNAEPSGMHGTVVLRPEPMRLDVKVVLLGDPSVYAALYYGDPDFATIFKIKAEFEEETDCTAAVLQDYARFCSRVVRKEGLPPLTREAVAAVIENAVRRAGKGARISTAFGQVADLVREAAFEAGRRPVDRLHVEAALRARKQRDDLAERRVLETLERGDLRILVSEGRVGQVNGLAVYHVGGHDFGRPLRITCSVGAGRGGVVSIERESGLSGKVHDKGVQILTGLVRGRLGTRRVLAFTASLCFEQSYGRIDGDSASAGEALTLLSALARLPLRQDIAVTGSINQLGEVQSVGGVNEKIEGFYAACRVIGFTGSQGVVVPRHNVPDLCLSREVHEACRSGRFSVWAADRIEDLIELLSGLPAGAPDADGRHPADTFFGRAEAELDRLADLGRREGRSRT